MKNFRKLKIALLFLLCALIYSVAHAQIAPPAKVITSGLCLDPDITLIPVQAMTPSTQLPMSPYEESQGYNTSYAEGYWSDGKYYYGHTGRDIVNSEKNAGINDIKAIKNGYVVASLKASDSHKWGETIVLANRPNAFSNEIITHHYHHMHGDKTGMTTRKFNACEVVNEGDVLGKEGKTGHITGVHLHLGTRRWKNIAQLKQTLEGGVGGLLGVGYSYGDDKKLVKNLDPGGFVHDTFDDYTDPTASYAWSLPFVLDMRHRGIEFGLFDGRYGAGENVTRREAARWLKIAAQRSNTIPATPTFADVHANDPDLPYIEELTHYPSAYPVINTEVYVGKNDKHHFHPDDTIIRAEALKMVILTFYSAEFLEVYNNWIWKNTAAAAAALLHQFNDVSASDWFAPFVYFGAQKGLVAIQPLFNPSRNVTREEMAKWVSEGAATFAASLSAPCNTVICPADFFCDPSTVTCHAIPTCVPSETVICPAGGGYDGTLPTTDAGAPPIADAGIDTGPAPIIDSGIDSGTPLPIFDSGIDTGIVPPPPVCIDTYLASASPSCYTTPGGPTLCLAVQQVSGATWRYQVCKSGGSFLNNYKTVLTDDNHTTQLGDTFIGNPGDTCTPWRNFAVGYIAGYGPTNGAGVRVNVLSPASCVLPACNYSTGTVTIRKECL